MREGRRGRVRKNNHITCWTNWIICAPVLFTPITKLWTRNVQGKRTKKDKNCNTSKGESEKERKEKSLLFFVCVSLFVSVWHGREGERKNENVNKFYKRKEFQRFSCYKIFFSLFWLFFFFFSVAFCLDFRTNKHGGGRGERLNEQ